MLPGSMPPHTCFRIVLKPLWRSGPQAERRCRIEGGEIPGRPNFLTTHAH